LLDVPAKTTPVPEESARASTGDVFAMFIGMIMSNLVGFVAYLLHG
jgi:hypothetical protein